MSKQSAQSTMANRREDETPEEPRKAVRRRSSIREFDACRFVHPLLGYHIPIRQQGVVDMFENELDLDGAHVWLRQFYVKNKPFLSTAALLEILMATAAYQKGCVGAAYSPTLDCVNIMDALSLESPSVVLQSVIAHTPGETSYTLAVNWISDDGAEYEKCASALTRTAVGSQAMGGGTNMDDLLSRCDEHCEAENIYRQLHQRHEIRYGDLCRPLKWLKIGQDEALAKIEYSKTVCTPSFYIHPNVLEGVIQAVLGWKLAVDQECDTTVDGVAVTYSIARVQYARVAAPDDGGGCLFVHVTQQSDVVASATLLTAGGAYVGRLRDITLALRGVFSATTSRTSFADDSIYVLQWEQTERPTVAASGAGRRPSNWLVMCPERMATAVYDSLARDTSVEMEFLFINQDHFKSPWLQNRIRSTSDMNAFISALNGRMQPFSGIMHINTWTMTMKTDFHSQLFTSAYQQIWLLHQNFFKRLAVRQRTPLSLWTINKQNLFSAPFVAMITTLLADFPVIKIRNISVDHFASLLMEIQACSHAKEEFSLVRYVDGQRFVRHVRSLNNVIVEPAYFNVPATRFALSRHPGTELYHAVEIKPSPTSLKSDEVEILVKFISFSQGHNIAISGNVFRCHKTETNFAFGNDVYGTCASNVITHMVCRESSMALIPSHTLSTVAIAILVAFTNSVMWTEKILQLEPNHSIVVETETIGFQVGLLQRLFQHGAQPVDRKSGQYLELDASSYQLDSQTEQQYELETSSTVLAIVVRKDKVMVHHVGEFNQKNSVQVLKTVGVHDVSSYTCCNIQNLNREVEELLMQPIPSSVYPLRDINNAIINSSKLTTIIDFWPPVVDLENIPDDAALVVGIGIMSGVGSGLFELMFKFFFPYTPLYVVIDSSYTKTARKNPELKIASMNDRVRLAVIELGNRASLSGLFQMIRTYCTVISIVHSAPCCNEFPSFQDLSFSKLEEGMRRNVLAAWSLHLQSLSLPIGHFILVAGLSAAVGLKGHANSDAAYAFLATLSSYRRTVGLPGQCVHLGPWDIGAAMETPPTETLASMHEADGLMAIERAMNFDYSRIIIAKVDEQVALNWLKHQPSPIKSVVNLPAINQQIVIDNLTLRQKMVMEELTDRLILVFGATSVSNERTAFTTNLQMCREVLDVYKIAVSNITGSDSIIPKNALNEFLSLQSLTLFVLDALKQMEDTQNKESESIPKAVKLHPIRMSYSQAELLLNRKEDNMINFTIQFPLILWNYVTPIMCFILQKQAALRVKLHNSSLTTSTLSLTETYLLVYPNCKSKIKLNYNSQNKRHLIALKHVLQTHSNDWTININVDPVLLDTWSENLLIQEFMVTYQSLKTAHMFPKDKLKLTFADYASWEPTHLRNQIEKTREYWMSVEFSHNDIFPMTNINLAPILRNDCKIIEYRLTKSDMSRYDTFWSNCRSSPESVIISIFAVLCRIISGNESSTVALACNDQDYLPPALEPVIGRLDGIIPLEISNNFETFEELLVETDKRLLALQPHRITPLSCLINQFPHLSRLKTIQTTIVTDFIQFSDDMDDEHFNVHTESVTNSDITWICAELSKDRVGRIIYRKSAFSETCIRQYLQLFYRLSTQLLQPHSNLKICTDMSIRRATKNILVSYKQNHRRECDYPKTVSLINRYRGLDTQFFRDLLGWHSYGKFASRIISTQQSVLAQTGTIGVTSPLASLSKIDCFQDLLAVAGPNNMLIEGHTAAELLTLTDKCQINEFSTLSINLPYSLCLAIVNNSRIVASSFAQILDHKVAISHIACDRTNLLQQKVCFFNRTSIQNILLMPQNAAAQPFEVVSTNKYRILPQIQMCQQEQGKAIKIKRVKHLGEDAFAEGSPNKQLLRLTMSASSNARGSEQCRRLNGHWVTMDLILSALNQVLDEVNVCQLLTLAHIYSTEDNPLLVAVMQIRSKYNVVSSEALRAKAKDRGLSDALIPDFFIDLSLAPRSAITGCIDQNKLYDILMK